eukprot:11866288-Alexandrium_andersonii.AAC.1
MCLSRAWNRRKTETPSVATLSAGGAEQSTAPPARSGETSGPPFSADPKPWARRRGLLRPQPHFYGM